MLLSLKSKTIDQCLQDIISRRDLSHTTYRTSQVIVGFGLATSLITKNPTNVGLYCIIIY